MASTLLTRFRRKRTEAHAPRSADAASSGADDTAPPAPAPGPQAPAIRAVRSFDRTEVPASLLDADAEARFRDVGYAVVDFLDPDATAALLALAEKHHPAPTSTWESDFYFTSMDDKREIGDGIRGAFTGPMEAHLTGHRLVMTNFVVNWPGPDGGLVMHQHTSLVDEAKHRSVIIWVALTDATEATGTLHVVPRSHHVPQRCWGEGAPDWFDEHRDFLHQNHLDSVEVRAGQALVFDNALLHCSFSNTTSAPRMTAVAIATPDDAELRYYLWTPADELEVYHLDPEFFFERISSGFRMADPEGLELITTEPAPPIDVTTEDLAALLSPGTCVHHPHG